MGYLPIHALLFSKRWDVIWLWRAFRLDRDSPACDSPAVAYGAKHPYRQYWLTAYLCTAMGGCRGDLQHWLFDWDVAITRWHTSNRDDFHPSAFDRLLGRRNSQQC